MGEGFIKRPHWGGYMVLDRGDGYAVKRLEFEGGAVRKQRHAYRDEHWLCVHGRISGYVSGERFELEPGDSVDIPAGEWHQLGGYGIVIETWIGDNLAEDDIEIADGEDDDI